eukprot:4392512-Amphidinium_carterae.1
MNHFSCKLPTASFVQPGLSLALIGNSFSQPSLHFPPWIHAAERGTLFCVPKKQGMDLLMQFLLSLACFCFAIGYTQTAIFRRRKRRSAYARVAWLAWHQTCLYHASFTLASCVLFSAYGSVHFLTCTVAFQRLNILVAARYRKLQNSLDALALLWVCYTSSRFFEAHAGENAPGGRRRPVLKVKGGRSKRVVVYGVVWNLWILLCVLASAPAAIYAAVRAIPGFLPHHARAQYFLEGGFFLLTSVVSSAGLPFLGRLLSAASKSVVDDFALLSVGQLLGTPVIPAL